MKTIEITIQVTSKEASALLIATRIVKDMTEWKQATKEVKEVYKDLESLCEKIIIIPESMK